MSLRFPTLALGLALLLLSAPAGADVPAFDDGDWLPIEAGARVLVHPFTGSETLHRAEPRESVLVIGTSGDFLRARLTDGRIGWVLPESLARAEPLVIERAVEVFPESGGRATALGDVRRGESVLVLERRADWSRVVTESGAIGWISATSADPARDVATSMSTSRSTPTPTPRAPAREAMREADWLAIVATAAQLRRDPSLDSDVVGDVRELTRVSVVAESGEWVRVVAPTASGWLPRHFLAVDERTPPSDVVVVEPVRPLRAAPVRAERLAPAWGEDDTEGWVALAKSIRLREQPSWNAASHAYVREWRTLRPIGGSGEWVLVETSSDEIGWIPAPTLTAALEPGAELPPIPAEPVQIERRFRIVDIDPRGQAPSSEAMQVDLIEITQPLVVRVGPSLTAMPVVGLLPGDQVTVIQQVGGWTRVLLPNRRVGWVPSSALGLFVEAPDPVLVAAAPEAEPMPRARRAPPWRPAPPRRPAPPEDRVPQGKEDVPMTVPDELEVRSPEIDGPRRVLLLPAGSALRPEPFSGSGELAMLGAGREIVVLDADREDWIFVETSGGRRGWLRVHELGGTLHELDSRTLARRSPAHGARIVDELDRGDLVVVRQRFGDWLEIRTPDGSAWIAADATRSLWP